MYKLVVISGKLRGSQFEVGEGQFSIGKNAENDIHLDLPGISKRHCALFQQKQDLFLEDLNSSNGTLVNKKIVKKTHLKAGDIISLPGVSFKVVFIKKKYISSQSTDHQEETKGSVAPPKSLFAKIPYIFRYKFMPILYSFNKEYDWKSIFASLLSIFIVMLVYLTIRPVLEKNKKILVDEMALRGGHYAEEIARLNSKALEMQFFDQLDTKFLESEEGVVSYELFDLEGRIYRPLASIHKSIADSFSVYAYEKILENKNNNKVIKKRLTNGEIGIAKAIKAFHSKSGQEQIVGIIAIRFAPKNLLLESVNNTSSYLEALLTSLIIGFIFYFMLYYVTTNFIQDIRFQIDDVLMGKKKDIEEKYKFSEAGELIGTLNLLLQKNKELQNDDFSEFEDLEADTVYVEQLSNIFAGIHHAAIVLDSESKVININERGEDLLGVRLALVENEALIDHVRDQGLSGAIIDLIQKSTESRGQSQNVQYEIGGKDYTVYVSSLLGKDHFMKASLITFVVDS